MQIVYFLILIELIERAQRTTHDQKCHKFVHYSNISMQSKQMDSVNRLDTIPSNHHYLTFMRS